MKKLRFALYALYIITALSACNKNDSATTPPPPPTTQQDIAVVDSKVQAFMTANNIPGASIAISKNGKLVYRKGYGVADKSTNEKVTADHRFRLASVSKTYTGVAIMKLVQEGKLSLDAKVFGTGAVLGTQYGAQPYSVNLKNITVKQLLQHTSGGWGFNSGGDPIDLYPTYSNAQFLSWVLDNKPVANTPGTRFDYSNMGYFISGRIIEKISGKTYVNYIKEDILSGLGATQTDIAGITLADIKPNEVKYFGQGSDAPYVYNIAFNHRDADGGLIATATDLLRFVLAIDGFSTRADILNSAGIGALTTPSGLAPLDPNYCLGIGKYNDYWYNYGSLPGTYTGFIRLDNGMSAVLLLNSRVPNNAQFTYDMQDVMLNTLRDNSINWQNIDQF